MPPATLSDSHTPRDYGKDLKQNKNLLPNTQIDVPQSGYKSQDPAGSFEEQHMAISDTSITREPSFTRFCHEFSNATADLNTTSKNISETLDTTYSSILQKLSVLQITVKSLKELSAMSQQLNVDFQSEGDDLLHESNAQIDSFDDFRDQAARIAELKERVNVGRENISNLGDRVTAVRKRVEIWETLERERRKKTKIRLRFTLACIACTLTLILLLHILPMFWMNENTKKNYGQASSIDMSRKYSRHIDFITDDIPSLKQTDGPKKYIKITPRVTDEL